MEIFILAGVVRKMAFGPFTIYINIEKSLLKLHIQSFSLCVNEV